MAQRQMQREESEGSMFRRLILCDDTAIANARISSLLANLYEAKRHNSLPHMNTVPNFARMMEYYETLQDAIRRNPADSERLQARFIREHGRDIAFIFGSERFVHSNSSLFRSAASRLDQPYESSLSKLETLHQARSHNLLMGEGRVPGLSRLLDAYEALSRQIQQDPANSDALRLQFRRSYARDLEALASWSIARTVEEPHRLLVIPTSELIPTPKR